MSTNESVRVMVRFRPTNDGEKKKARESEPWKTLQSTDKGIRMNGNELSMYNIQEHGATNITFKTKRDKFTFDALMDEKTTQIDAFESVAQQICDEIIQGYNGTIFVYGQSGSGKTHTMYGPEENKDNMDIHSMGIIPQSCAYVFEILDSSDHPLIEGMLSYEVQCEFIEIYNEKLKDLLDLSNKPEIKQICTNPHRDEWKVIVRNVERRKVRNLCEVLTAIRYASSNRTVAVTNLNATSSRSHMVMKLIVKIETADGIRTGIGNFSDLAGSEKVKKTGAKGQRLQEAKNILKSLSTLSRVIEALVLQKLPPFADSKLTFMLKDSLGGNCKTALLIACSPHVFNRDETVRSLRFGVQCRKIQNKAKINAIRTKAQLIKENETLKKKIEKLKKHSMDDDTKLTEIKEKEKLNQRIKELENVNNKLSQQIQENNKEKAISNQQFMKLNNEFEELKVKAKEFKEMESYKKQRNELSSINKRLNQSNNELNVENQRLKESNEQQMDDINKLRKHYEKIEFEQQNVQNKWKSEFESKKSQFSKQEMELSKTIGRLQLQIKQTKQVEESMKRELSSTQNKLKEKQKDIHALEDKERKIMDDLNNEKDKYKTVSVENKELKIEIKELLSKLREQKTKNSQHFNDIYEQQSKINNLEFEIETKCNELQFTQNNIHEMEKNHRQEINNLKYEMESLVDLNQQLQKENKTASDVVDSQKMQISKHNRRISKHQQENSIIEQQLKQLKSHYGMIIQQQIETDHKLATKIDEEQRVYYGVTPGGDNEYKEESDDEDLEEQQNAMFDALVKQQKELQTQIEKDKEKTESIYWNQMRLREEKEKRLYISADKIKETDYIDEKDDYMMSKKKKRDYKKLKAKQLEEEQNYLDPNDGMGLIIMDDSDEY